jgi:hypothetical protein
MLHHIKQDESKRCPFTYEACTYGGGERERVVALSILNLGAKKEWVVNATPRPSLPRGKTPGTPRARGWVYPVPVWMGPEILAPHRNSNPRPSIP